MGSRKLVRDVVLAKQNLRVLQHHWQAAGRRQSNAVQSLRPFSIFNEFSKQVKGQAKSNEELQQSLKKFNEQVGGIKEDLKARTKETTEKLYRRVDGIWTEAEETTKKASASAKEKISAATEEVKETLGLGKKDSSESSENASEGTNPPSSSLFDRLKNAVSSASPSISSAFEKVKEAKVFDLAKKGYHVVKEELTGSPKSQRQQMQNMYKSTAGEETSSRRDVVILPSKQSRLGKKWEAFKEKMRGHPMFKRVSGISEPIVSKGQEIAEDVRERWEMSDNPVVHKIQDLNETVFGETSTALSFKEIRRRDPYFSLPEFVAEVQEMIRPTLMAYLKGEVEKLKDFCCKEVIERCRGERAAYETQGMFFENKILHISDVDVRETKMMGSSPIIIVAFQTQQIYCVRDKQGSITSGGEDTIQTVYYAWAMQLMEEEEMAEQGVHHPTWRLREMQQFNVQALI